MQVFKFGGASVSSASSIKNAAGIIRMFSGPKVIVISAMGKTTNALEDVVRAYFKGDSSMWDHLATIRKYHDDIMLHLSAGNEVNWSNVETLFSTLEERMKTTPSMNFDYEYDQVVSYGELISTAIISSFYQSIGLENKWIDIRKSLITDDMYREANINWEISEKKISATFDLSQNQLFITQGFLGGTTTSHTTTLGREGSDYTAAILGNMLSAQDVTIWKNVPGVLNADPDFFSSTQKLDELSYREAIELSYSGARVIHPKTIKPLQNKHIPLLVKSFEEPDQPGTIIHEVDHPLNLVPVFIIKQKQALITLSQEDYSFISIHTISEVFALFAKYRLKVGLIQQSALDLSLAFDEPEQGVEELIAELRKRFDARYNTGLDLVTIRFYNQDAINEITKGRQVYIEQKTRRTARLLLK